MSAVASSRQTGFGAVISRTRCRLPPLGAVLAVLVLWSLPAAAQAPPETIEYYGTDALGSIRVVFDPQGNVLGRSDYLPFGDSLQPSGNLPRQRFTGQERDGEAGMDYFNARSYHLRTGRFNRPDPLAADALVNPQAWNRYAYAANNPLRMVDPTGMARVEKDTRFAQIDQGMEEGILSSGAAGRLAPGYMNLDASGHGIWAPTWTDILHSTMVAEAGDKGARPQHGTATVTVDYVIAYKTSTVTTGASKSVTPQKQASGITLEVIAAGTLLGRTLSWTWIPQGCVKSDTTTVGLGFPGVAASYTVMFDTSQMLGPSKVATISWNVLRSTSYSARR